VDVETTGLDFDAECIIELAAARFENGEPVAEFQAFLPPTKALTSISSLLTGLREEDLRTAPPAAETLRAFLDFAGDLPLVAHNAEFDSLFLRRTLEREGLPQLTGPWLDSLLLARAAWPAWESHRLDSLAQRLDILREAEHRALPDARRAGRVFLAAQRFLLASVSPDGLNSLARLAEDLPGWKEVFPFADESAAKIPLAKPVENIEPAAVVATVATVPIEAAETSKMAEALLEKRWMAWESSPQEDEFLLGLQAAAMAASKGVRVLLCVPDIVPWNNLRKHVWPRLNAELRGTLKLTALAEPQGYLCRRRLAAILKNPGNSLPTEERALALPLAAWADRTPSSFIADCRGFSPDRNRLLWSRVCCDAYDEDPEAQAARAEAESADIILITYAALFSHLKLEGALLPACDTVILAGAHRLIEMARRGFGREVTFFRLNPILRLLRQSREKDTGLWPLLERRREKMGFTEEEWTGLAQSWFESEKQFQKFFQKMGKQAMRRRAPGENRIRYTEPVALAFGTNPEPVLLALKEQETFLQRCQENLARLGPTDSMDPLNQTDPVGEVRRILSRLRAFRLDFEKLCDARDSGEVYWLEDFSNPHKAALRSTPLDLRADFGLPLQSSFDGGLLLSPAMMLAGDGGWFFLRLLGLSGKADEVDEAGEGGETDPEDAPVAVYERPAVSPPRFLLAPFVPAVASMESAAAFAHFLFESAAPFSEKGVYVLFTSPGPLRAVYQALRALLPAGAPVWAQHVDGGKDTLSKLFASARGGWILASEGMEGLYDADGRSPALAVVARMPLPSMREPWWEAQGENLRTKGRNLRYDLWHPAAALRLKRELAPLRRHEADAAKEDKESREGLKMVWLLDARASGEGLGAYAARSLGCEPQTAADLAALQAATRAVLF